MTAASSPIDWVYVMAPFWLYGIIVLALLAFGSNGDATNPVTIFFKRISTSLETATGYPAWSMAGALTGLTFLAVAAMGLYWDVAFHIDNGRDKNLFTPSHVMILLGLGGLVWSAGTAVVFASIDKAAVRLRVGPIRLPWSAVALAGLGIGGVAAFPLDNLWHEAYGIDVTLWSPTHLQLVAGGGLGPIAVWLMIREGRREWAGQGSPTILGRIIEVTTFGAILTGLSTFQGEFDFGVPQFQALYFPILIAVAAGISLTAARIALGAGGAVLAVIGFLVLRSALALLVGGSLNHTVPRFPLYIAGALAVEAVAWFLGTDRRLRFAAVAGVAVALFELVGESIWVDVSGWGDPSASLLPKALVFSILAAVAGAVIGTGLGGAADSTDSDGVGVDDMNEVARQRRIPAAAFALAGVGLVAAMAYPLPRNVGPVDAVISLQRTGDEALATVTLDPPEAAHDATLFGIVSWQGGGRVSAELREVGPGRYVASRAVPVTGVWKSMVGLQRGSQVMAAPIYLPADPEIGAPAVPALAERRVAFSRNTEILLRETKDGPAWPAIAAYLGVAVVASMWIFLLGLAVIRIGRGDTEDSGDPGSSLRQPAPAMVPPVPVGGWGGTVPGAAPATRG
ncbi:MAG TPA: hypothetical protein VM142_03305 [Acidimicrobiales bacterium]|nr:hypothetical protein [Acidimicrobiales bacterium]